MKFLHSSWSTLGPLGFSRSGFRLLDLGQIGPFLIWDIPTKTFLEWNLGCWRLDVASRFMFVYFDKWVAELSFLAVCWHVSMLFFPCTPFSSLFYQQKRPWWHNYSYQKKTQKTGQTDIFRQLQHPTRFLDLSRGYSSRGVLKQQLQTAVESTGSFEMLWSAVGELGSGSWPPDFAWLLGSIC